MLGWLVGWLLDGLAGYSDSLWAWVSNGSSKQVLLPSAVSLVSDASLLCWLGL